MRAPSWMIFVAGAVGFCGLLACACSLFTSLDGYSGSNDVSPGPPDVAVQADGGPADAPTDATSDDAAPSGPFCASLVVKPAICEDFDSAQPLAAWNVREVGAGSTVATTTGAFRSAPQALRAAIGPSEPIRRAALHRNVSTTVSHARFAYSLYVDEWPTTGRLEVNIVRFDAGGGGLRDFFLAVSANDVRYVEQSSGLTTQIPLSVPIPLKTWVRIELEVVLTGTKPVVVRVDGVEAARTTAAYAAPGAPNVGVGITYTGPEAEAGVVLLDDVTFEILN